MKNKYDEIHAYLAKEGKFDTYTTPMNEDHKKVDDAHVYLPKNIFVKMGYGLFRGFVTCVQPLVNFFAFGLKVKGRKHLKKVKTGAITVANHVHYLDCIAIRQACFPKSFYTTAAPHNNKKGVAGSLLRAAGELPLGETFSAQKNFNQAVATLLKKKKLINFYAEQSLWFRYEKSRPYKPGAFRFAVTNNVPVVPIVLCFKELNKFERILRRQKKLVVIIQEPIYPNTELDTKEQVKDLQARCQKVYDDTIIDFYGYDKNTYSYYE